MSSFSFFLPSCVYGRNSARTHSAPQSRRVVSSTTTRLTQASEDLTNKWRDLDEDMSKFGDGVVALQASRRQVLDSAGLQFTAMIVLNGAGLTITTAFSMGFKYSKVWMSCFGGCWLLVAIFHIFLMYSQLLNNLAAIKSSFKAKENEILSRMDLVIAEATHLSQHGEADEKVIANELLLSCGDLMQYTQMEISRFAASGQTVKLRLYFTGLLSIYSLFLVVGLMIATKFVRVN